MRRLSAQAVQRTGAGVLLTLWALGVSPGSSSAEEKLQTKARFQVVDLHVDLSYEHTYEGHPFETGTGQYVASALVSSGVSGAVLPLFVPNDVTPNGPGPADYERSYTDVFSALVRTPPFSLPGCNGSGVRTWLSFEGAEPLGRDPSSVVVWIARGARLFGLVHKDDNSLAGSATGKRRGGLTETGVRLVQKIYELGGIVDVSHASDAAARDILRLAAVARRPVVATHSNARALADHPRNLPDDLLRGIAQSGGVVGINFHSPYLARGRAATIDDVVSHIRYAVRLAGAEHVAIGSDFEGDIRPPTGLSDVRDFDKLAEALLQAGLSRDQVEKVFSKNALRLLCGAGDARN